MDFKQFYKTINFDIDNEIRTVFQATQGDTKSRGLLVDLIVGGVKTPVTTEKMTFFALKPDGTRVMTVGIKEGTGFRIDFTSQTFAVPGVLLCTLVLSGTNGEKIADKKFKMTVDSSLEDGAIISEDERGILDRAFDLANDIVPRLEGLDVPLLENVDSEITLARGTEPTLGARLDGTDAQLAETGNKIDDMTVEVEYISKNLFDGEVEHGTFVYGTGVKGSHDTRVINTNPISVIGGSDIVVKAHLGNATPTDSLQIWEYDKDMVFIEQETELFHSAERNHMKLKENTRYIHFRTLASELSLSDVSDGLQIEYGTIATDYEPYFNYKRSKLNITPETLSDGLVENRHLSEGAVTPEKTAFFDKVKIKSKNLFNKETRDLDIFINPVTGLLQGDTKYDTSDFIPIDDNKQYYINYTNRIAWFDTSKVYISSDYGGVQNILTPPTNAKYIRITIRKENVDLFQIEEGTKGTSYEPYFDGYKFTLKNEHLDLSELELPVNPIPTESELPEFILNEVAIKENKLLTSPHFKFSFTTDLHINNEEKFTKLDEIKRVNKLELLNFISLGGDIIDGFTNNVGGKKMAIKTLSQIIARLRKDTDTPILMCQGNHDTNFYNYDESSSDNTENMVLPPEWGNITVPKQGVVIDTDNINGQYYFYKDFEGYNIRVIVLNTSDGYDENFQPLMGMANLDIQQQQFSWLCNKALNFMDKPNKSDWGIIILSHGDILGAGDLGSIGSSLGGWQNPSHIKNVLTAFKNGGAYSGTSNSGSPFQLVSNVDFTEQGAVDVICAINGHAHLDFVRDNNGIKTIFVPCSAKAQRSGYPSEGDIYTRVAPYRGETSTAPDRYSNPYPTGELINTAWDIFEIDRINRKIYTTRFGAGADRVIDY